MAENTKNVASTGVSAQAATVRVELTGKQWVSNLSELQKTVSHLTPDVPVRINENYTGDKLSILKSAAMQQTVQLARIKSMAVFVDRNGQVGLSPMPSSIYGTATNGKSGSAPTNVSDVTEQLSIAIGAMSSYLGKASSALKSAEIIAKLPGHMTVQCRDGKRYTIDVAEVR